MNHKIWYDPIVSKNYFTNLIRNIKKSKKDDVIMSFDCSDVDKRAGMSYAGLIIGKRMSGFDLDER